LHVEAARGATLLLPIDQLEELFTIAEAEERIAFLRLMASSCASAGRGAAVSRIEGPRRG
jgi:hypothetical protein